MTRPLGDQAGPGLSLTFDLAGLPGGGPSVKRLRVTAASQSAEFEFDTAGGTDRDLGWVSKTWEFTAAASRTTLEFSSLDPGGSYGPLLDNICVVPAPQTNKSEPSR